MPAKLATCRLSSSSRLRAPLFRPLRTDRAGAHPCGLLWGAVGGGIGWWSCDVFCCLLPASSHYTLLSAPYSLLPAPCSRLPTSCSLLYLCSLLPAPYSRLTVFCPPLLAPCNMLPLCCSLPAPRPLAHSSLLFNLRSLRSALCYWLLLNAPFWFLLFPSGSS